MSRGTRPTASVLAVLFPSVTHASFLSDLWRRSAHFVEHGQPDRFSCLFDASNFGDTREVLLQHRQNVTCRVYGRDGELRDFHRVSAEDAFKMYQLGATVHLDNFNLSFPFVNATCQRLAAELGLAPELIRCTAFASLGPGRGSPIHSDNKDLFVLHLVGNKTWRVDENRDLDRQVDNVHPWSARGPTALRNAIAETTVHLRAGSVLFLPRNHWHATEVPAERCFAITIGFERPPWVRVIATAVYNLMLERAELREAVGSAWGESGQRIENATRASQLARLLAQELLETSGDELLAKAFPVANDRRYAHRPNSQLTLEESDAAAGKTWIGVVHASGCRNEFVVEDGKSREVFEWISQRMTPFSASDIIATIPGLALSQVTTFIDELIELKGLDSLPCVGVPRSAFHS